MDDKKIVRFHITEEGLDRLEFGEFLDVLDGKGGLDNMRSVLSHFLVDERGQVVPHDEAMTAIRYVTIGQIREASARIKDLLAGSPVPNE